MKRYIQYYLLTIVSLFGLSSCLDGDPVFEPDGGPMGIVEISLPARQTATPYSVKATTLEVVDEILLPVEINYTGFNGAPSDVQVTLAIDNNIVSEYAEYSRINKSGDSILVPLPSGNYELPSSNTVIIPKGEKKATYTIKLKPKTFDVTKAYALGVKIQGATGGTVSGNYAAGVYTLPVKSPWQGTYNVHYRWYAGGGFGTADEEYDEAGVKLTTVGPGIVEAQYVGYWFSGSTQYTVKTDNTVTAAPYSGGVLATTIVSSNADWTALTFRVRYSFLSGRYELEETYVRTGD
ncbi:MAG: DUF1735 domain-containing protein [Dysgonamonadaceae bacterium]|jgi:hypothetical protein|nr:DUF1735 domain-containing protein [Dysgonamonadaceae bacterium]